MVRSQTCQHRVVRKPRKDIPQPVFDDAETEAFFQHFGGLFEDDDLQPVADARDIRRWSVERQCRPAHDERVVRRQIGAGVNRLAGDARPFEPSAGFALGVEERYSSARLYRLRRRQDLDGKGIGLRFAGAEFDRRRHGISTWRGASGNIEAQRNTLLIAGLQAHRLAAGDDLGQREGPTALARDGLARVVDDDELFSQLVRRQ